MLRLMLFLTLAVCANIVSAWTLPTPESAPAEPDFTSAGGGSVTLGGNTFLIKITVYYDDEGNFAKNTTKVTKNGGTEHSYDNTTVNSPVNVVTDGVQIWVGTPGDDVIFPDTSWNDGATPPVILPAIMIGLAGNDIIIGTNSASGDVLCGNADADTILGRGGPDRIWGGAGSDGVAGNDGDDKICGGADADKLGFNSIRSAGSDGGTDGDGNQLWDFGSSTHSVTVTDGVEMPLFLSDGAGGDAKGGLWGCAGDDHIWGEAGADRVFGDGDEDLSSSDGANWLYGGSEADIITGGESTDNIWGGAGGDTILGGLGWTDNRNTDSSDYLFGDDDNDNISGRGGADYVNGGAGDDHLYGFRSGGYGIPDSSNFIDGGSSGQDTIDGADHADDLMGGDERDTISGGDVADRIDGEAGMDIIDGGEYHDYIWCGAGDDVAVGGYGNDFMTGEADSDYLYGDGGNDRLVDTSGGIADYLYGDNSSADNGADELNAYDGNSSGPTIHDFLQGFSPNNESVWADDADSILDVPAETPTLSAGPTTPADGTSRPTRP